jgi:hypothetical protein
MARPLSLIARPLVALLNEETEKDGCFVPQHLWKRWIDAQETEVLLVEIYQGNVRFVLCVEGPHQESGSEIYIPDRYIHDLVFEERINLRVLDEMPPKATEIVLQPLDSGFCGVDIASAASQLLSHWNVLSTGTILSIPCEELGGFQIDVLVKRLEPASTVLLRGEVPLVIENPVEAEAEAEAQAEAEAEQNIIIPHSIVKQSIVELEDEDDADNDFASMIPISLPQGSKQITAFSGKGYRLG